MDREIQEKGSLKSDRTSTVIKPVTSREAVSDYLTASAVGMFTCFHYIHIEKNGPPIGGHDFSPIWTIFKLVRDINKTNVLTNFLDDWAKIPNKENCPPPPGSHVFQLTRTIFELNSHIKEKNKTAPPAGGHVFHRSGSFSNSSEISIKPMFFVTSRVFTRKTAPPTGGHVFQGSKTTFELNQHIIKKNILTSNMKIGHEIFELDRDVIGTKFLTKFHEDRTINVASRVFTNKCGRTDGRTDDGQRPVTKAHLSNQVSLKKSI
ncbi:hypothetical protein DPMN_063548 [Dreissena polymorpha]|uniref:Uncharacterized protein n=1 Tax=Dreissena polymorpha TaxID=45954 RepID=A0A9D4CBM9_DREPO|nr:hypothetical protein DPMN_063548 [Dreissena polymorpha]